MLGGISDHCYFPTSSRVPLCVLWINSRKKGAFVSSSVGGMARGGTDNPACKQAERLQYSREGAQ